MSVLCSLPGHVSDTLNTLTRRNEEVRGVDVLGDGHMRLWNSGRKCRLDRAPIFLFLLVFALLLALSPSFWVT